MALEIKRVGSFHLPGREAMVSGIPTFDDVLTPGGPVRTIDQNGAYEVEQMYVQFVKLDAPRARYPLLLWHGGGMTGVTWEDTPDGRPGWQMAFLEFGHDVYVSDAVERGRASFSPLTGIYGGDPFVRTKQECWEGFRVGPVGSWHAEEAERSTYDGQRFPVDAFDSFVRQTVPRWTVNDVATQTAYDQLVQRVGPAVLMSHSQSGNFGFTAALHAPDKVSAVIGIEPSGTPLPDVVDVSKVRDIPHLVVWGDFIEEGTRWPDYQNRIKTYRDALQAAGGSLDIIDLPALGIRGNSHFPMMDDNSDTVAALVQEWIESKGLMR
ncbi:MAG: esterase [Rhodospirillaceae bacterium]|jgi:pimeloyl-ACP methyl ester carboxylesterase|nr:esterase [Rhodospirillaceae bacterium]|tara:strand:- start:814 stop:1782 length:969 start_codon:yes stop_codon:yes gene_type:complete